MRAADYTYRLRRGRQDLRGRAAVDRVRDWSKGRDRSRPFFLFVNLMEAHLPYFTPRAPAALHEAGAGPLTTYRALRLIEVERSFRYNMGLFHDGHVPAALEALRSVHRHAAAYLDERIAELHEASAADGRGLVTVVTSDHGDAFGEHQAVFHGITLDEPILHIPLVVSGDGVPVGTRAETVELRQVYATLLQAAGVEAEGAAPSLMDGSDPFVVSERGRIDAPAGVPATPRVRERLGRMRAVYRDPYKLVVTEEGTRLYDLSGDPGEETDRAGDHPDVVEELTRALPPWPETDPTEEPAPGGPSSESDLSPREQEEIARQLAALGYLE
jgi:arylsulfatase A-like enzyme